MHTSARHRPGRRSRMQKSGPATTGLILRGGWRYDLQTWAHDIISFRGKLRELRSRTLALAQVQPGEAVLDVGCGTGTLTVDAARLAGTTGYVAGVDPGREQIACAHAKAARRGLSIDFQVGVIEQLPFPDQTFQVVFSTLVMHHLPAPLQRRGLAEIARVLTPAGRLVMADFTHRTDRAGRAARFHAGGSRVHDLVALLKDAGFTVVETEEIRPLRFSAFPGASILRAYKDGEGTHNAKKAGEMDT